MIAFYDRHVCRVVPRPPELAHTFAAIADWAADLDNAVVSATALRAASRPCRTTRPA